MKRIEMVSTEEIKEIMQTTMAKYGLFEFNDETRSGFIKDMYSVIEPDESKWLVVCDETNNTPQVISANEFVADIYIKRGDSLTQLNMVLHRDEIETNEVRGTL